MRSEPSLSNWARTAFGAGFFEAGVLKAEHRRESALSLAYAVISRGISAGQLRAFTLAIRHIADSEKPEGSLSPCQMSELRSLATELELPEPFVELMTEMMSILKTTEELTAFYGVLSGAEEAYESIFRAREIAMKK